MGVDIPGTRGMGRHHTFPVPELLILRLIDARHSIADPTISRNKPEIENDPPPTC